MGLPELIGGEGAGLPGPLGRLQQRHVQLVQCHAREDLQAQQLRVQPLAQRHQLAAQVLLATKLKSVIGESIYYAFDTLIRIYACTAVFRTRSNAI